MVVFWPWGVVMLLACLINLVLLSVIVGQYWEGMMLFNRKKKNENINNHNLYCSSGKSGSV